MILFLGHIWIIYFSYFIFAFESLILWFILRYRSLRSGVGNGNLLQYSCLENSMDKEPGGLHSMELQRVGHDWAIEQTCTEVKIF